MVSRSVRSRPMRNLRTNRILGLAVAVFVVACAAPHAVMAQAPASGGTTAPAQPYWAAINANNVFIRSSPSVSSSYPFGRLSTGDVVQVVEESFGWARVRCTGPAFNEIHGFVPADRRVELSSDGTTLKVTARTEIKAPNINSKDSPDASWKPIGKLAPGETLKVLGTIEGEREKVYRVALNDSAEGFINLNYLRRASPAEAEAYRASGATRTVASTPSGTEAARGAAASGQNPANATPSADGPRSIADERRIRARPAGANAEADAAEITKTTEEKVIAEVIKPDGEVDVAERDTIVTKTRRNEAASAQSPADLETAANRRAYEDLEAIWETVRMQPLESAEISVLRNRYLELVTRSNVPSDLRQMSKARGEQLALKMEVQTRMYELERLKAQRSQDLDRIRAISLAMEARSDYDAVGVLNASTVFDGNRLPALLRLQDPAVGQTVAYVVPRDDFQLSTMLGLLVGIKGEKRYDAALRVNMIEPRAVDILTQRRSPQAGTVGGPTDSGTSGSTDSAMPSSAPSETQSTSSGEPIQYAPVPPDAP